MSASEQAAEAFNLVQAIRPMLVGKSPEVQGAVLADLLATWLAGHVLRGDPTATTRMHEQILKLHIKAVRSLIEPNYKLTVEPQIKRNTQ